ncbi:MAG: hypothetical protein ABH860_04975 [bacterium]
MRAEGIEQISETSSIMSVSESRVKNARKIFSSAKMCAFFKDMECRIPVCDLKACEKCNEGHVYCTRVSFIKNMIQKVLLFFIGFIIISEL